MDATFHGTSNPSTGIGAQVSEIDSRHAPTFGEDAPPADGAPAPAAPPAASSLAQAVQKAQDKAKADIAVATDPHASHGVVLSVKSPKVLGSTAVGAGIGMAIAGPPGAVLGALVGLAAEKYQIAGGPVGRGYDWIKAKLGK